MLWHCQKASIKYVVVVLFPSGATERIRSVADLPWLKLWLWINFVAFELLLGDMHLTCKNWLELSRKSLFWRIRVTQEKKTREIKSLNMSVMLQQVIHKPDFQCAVIFASVVVRLAEMPGCWRLTHLQEQQAQNRRAHFFVWAWNVTWVTVVTVRLNSVSPTLI